MHVKSWTLVLCSMHDYFRGSRLDSSLTKLLAQTVAECLLKRMMIKNVLYLIQLPFFAHYFSICGYFLLSCRLENVCGAETAGSFIS